eukprot:TRINITY_DN20171_c0_g1_i1.p1 TRINITY_DN20171_c0_g1~~TRINITY_DN20171_c0_g1_i1.p1  ORF type:complete len:268 (-),score=37.74 TRINITY_DN20171_c0_g1_i1:55-858(-)
MMAAIRVVFMLVACSGLAHAGWTNTTCPAANCTGYNNTVACTRDGTMYFQLNAVISFSNTTASACSGQKGAAFCPVVDTFAGITVNQSSENEIATCGQTEITLYSQPPPYDSMVLKLANFNYTEDGVTACVSTDNPEGRAYMEMAILNVTLKNGILFHRISNGDLVNTGLVSSCDSSAKCKFDSTLQCIGGDNGKNGYCASCLTSTTALSDADRLASNPQIFVAFYGTDSAGERMTSGGNNPILFSEYASSSISSKVKSAKSSLPSV